MVVALFYFFCPPCRSYGPPPHVDVIDTKDHVEDHLHGYETSSHSSPVRVCAVSEQSVTACVQSKCVQSSQGQTHPKHAL